MADADKEVNEFLGKTGVVKVTPVFLCQHYLYETIPEQTYIDSRSLNTFQNPLVKCDLTDIIDFLTVLRFIYSRSIAVF